MLRSYMFFFLIFALIPDAEAHRVNIFAYVEGHEVVVQCGFSRSNPVRHGQIEVYDQQGTLLLQGQTDQKGHFRFPVPQAALDNKSDLTIRILAGEGHENEWIIEQSELTALQLSSTMPASPDLSVTDGSGTDEAALDSVPAPAFSKADQEHDSSITLSRHELEAIIHHALDVQLAPIKRAVLEKSGPGLTEIIGGIGWILGLAGLAAYFKGRPRV